MQWYYVLNGARSGPVSQEQFDQLVQAGSIKGDTLVWRAGMEAWQTWAQVSGALSPEADTAVCAVSGRIYPKREMLEYEGRWVSAEHKDVFFQRIREGVAIDGAGAAERQYGGFWIRVVAAIIDGICTNVITFPMALVFGLFVGALGAGAGAGSSTITLVAQLGGNLIGVIVVLAYNVFFIRKYDATPGKWPSG